MHDFIEPEQKLLVVLDMDETLYYRNETSDIAQGVTADLITDIADDGQYVFYRPGMMELMKTLGSLAHVEYGFFTHSLMTPNLEQIIQALIEYAGGKSPLFVFDRSRATHTYTVSLAFESTGCPTVVKDLKKVARKTGMRIENMLAVDDKAIYPRQYGNLLKVEEFVPGVDHDDRTLYELADLVTRIPADRTHEVRAILASRKTTLHSGAT